jgi:uncharacterized protein
MSHPGQRMLHLAGQARTRRTGDLPHDVALFAGLLRAVGSGTSPAACLQALRALTMIQLDRPADFRAALACCLTSGTPDLARFDAVYDAFWTAGPALLAGPPGPKEAPAGDGRDGEGGPPGAQTGRSQTDGPAGPRPAAGRATWSPLPSQGGRVSARSYREIDALCRRLARTLGTAPGRRLVSGPRGETVDVRASLRQNLRFGEELLLLQRTTRRRDGARIAVLCDVSSSMMPYAPMFLAFVHTLTKLVRRSEAAVFNVDLAVVTEVFRDTTLAQAMGWLTHQQAVLSGGTRIGHCLHAFLRHLENRGVFGPAVTVLILSDGWDVGDADLLRDGMRRLCDQAGRVIWCDPHAAAAGYQPQVLGLSIALPYVDDYLDFSSITSLSQLVAHVAAGTGRSHR